MTTERLTVSSKDGVEISIHKAGSEHTTYYLISWRTFEWLAFWWGAGLGKFPERLADTPWNSQRAENGRWEEEVLDENKDDNIAAVVVAIGGRV